jgi:pullulanase/glycogen debranching enzyme
MGQILAFTQSTLNESNCSCLIVLTMPGQSVRSRFVYEMHVRGFTCHPSSGGAEKKHGTFAGLIEKIPYLKDLGGNGN